ncbi:MAG: glycosyltransferase family 2 protein [Myxococcaceae bacterium]|nr:glycosyltransferase family 2 protein [Myxococcaceae bacterium]
MRLSACLMVRDEERWLPGCLASLTGVADEVIVVDTGSRDATVSLARAAGARVEHLAWADDFSAPRNRAVALATGDWVLQIDADERLALQSGASLRAALEAGGFEAGLVRLHNAATLDAAPDEVLSGAKRLDEPQWLPRVFRRGPALQWQGVVHENVDAWLAATHEPPRGLDVDLVHFGAAAALKAERHKGERNIRLLTARCAADPDDAQAAGYLALELFERGDTEAADRTVEASWARLQRWPASRSVLRLAAARALLALQRRDFERMLATTTEALARGGPHPDLLFLEGRAHELCAELRAGAVPELQRAAEAYQAALALAGRGDWRLSFQGVSAPGCAVRCATAQLASGALEAAQATLDSAGRLPVEGVMLKAELALARGRANDALALLMPVMGARAPADAWLLAAAAAQALGAAADARVFFERAGGGGGRVAWHRRALADALSRRLG